MISGCKAPETSCDLLDPVCIVFKVRGLVWMSWGGEQEERYVLGMDGNDGASLWHITGMTLRLAEPSLAPVLAPSPGCMGVTLLDTLR